MNRRTFLAVAPGAVTLATTRSANASPDGRARILVPPWEPERIEDLTSAVPEVELVVAKDSLEQVRDVDATFGFIDQAHLRAGKRLRWVQQGSAVLHGEMDALERAGRQPASVYRESVIYTTLSPCAMCTGAILLYGIPHVVVGENRTFMGEEELLRARGVRVDVVRS